VIVVTDSGPLIHLAAVNQFRLLNRFFQHLLIIPQVYEEVVTQGTGRPGSLELQQAFQQKWITIEEGANSALIDRLTVPNISKTDAAVIAAALVRHATLLLADDIAVRTLAMREGLTVMGTIGILVHARLEGIIDRLEPVLDQLMAFGFYLDPAGRVYQDALRRVQER
jgi:predicted nucleic acid-binding protein